MSKRQLERCPACGQPVPSREARICELCGYEFVDRRVTNADVTPYAEAYSRNEPGFLRMLRWVVFASSERIKHLGLMRKSAASTRFAWSAILWFSLAVSLFANSRIGWHTIGSSGESESKAAMKPSGNGWFQISSTSTNSNVGAATVHGLWWNPAQGLIAASAAFIAGIILSWLCLGLLRRSATLAHSREFRGEGRMSAAIAYSMAFFALCTIGGVVISMRPIFHILNANSTARPSSDAIEILAAITTGAPLVVWWLWLIRLGSGAPASTRNNVTALMIVAPPVCLTGIVAAIYWGLEWFEHSVFPVMHLQF